MIRIDDGKDFKIVPSVDFSNIFIISYLPDHYMKHSDDNS